VPAPLGELLLRLRGIEMDDGALGDDRLNARRTEFDGFFEQPLEGFGFDERGKGDESRSETASTRVSEVIWACTSDLETCVISQTATRPAPSKISIVSPGCLRMTRLQCCASSPVSVRCGPVH
jgi:hypothetical protein